MSALIGWIITLIVVVTLGTFAAHLATVFRKPLERPRVRRRNRYGEPIGVEPNPGPEIAPGRRGASAPDDAPG